MNKVILKYRNGFPTKKSMYEFLKNFDPNFQFVRCGYNWSNSKSKYVTLIWQRKSVQEKMDDFIQYGVEHGLTFGKYDPYESPRVGHLQIMKKDAD